MRRPEHDHLDRPWRVHALAQELELLDVWRFPVRAGPEIPLAAFLDFLEASQRELLGGHSPAAWLFRLRGLLGRVFGWDAPMHTGSPPVTEQDETVGRPSLPGFAVVYREPDEMLAEVRNATVHAMLHLGRVTLDERGAWAPQMAVYAKPRGALGRVYMRLIEPFRHLIVYPTMMRHVERRWPRYAAERCAGTRIPGSDGVGAAESTAARASGAATAGAWESPDATVDPSEDPDPSGSRFARAIAAIDAANDADPHRLEFEGVSRPKERVHAERASHWLGVLDPEAGELLRLAVRAHHLRRWQLPRSEYPTGRAGYHAWRSELQRRHAREAAAILAECGYSEAETDRVAALIRKRGLGRDPEARLFEDALCLVFVETQLEAFAAGHPEHQVVSILAKTLPKMSEAARALAADLCRTPQTAALLEQASQRLAAEDGGSV